MKKKINTERTPIYRDAGFYLQDAGTTQKAFDNEKDHPWEPTEYIYSRYRNPSVVSAEKELAKIEESGWALLTQSGMSSVDIALSIFQRADKNQTWLMFSEIYGGTNSFIDKVLVERRGINVQSFVPEQGAYDLKELEKTIKEVKPELIYFEIISNPMLMVSDALAIIYIAKKYGAMIIIDNTFSSSYLWKPLDFGADLVIYSATKYLSGHGDLTAGAVCGNDPQLLANALEYRKLVGHMLSPDDANRLESQMKTFHLRFEKQCANAFALAIILEKHEMIEEVLYPGLKSHLSHANAKKLFGLKGFGAMITFDLKGKNIEEKAKFRDSFISSLKNTIPLIPSLGDVHTTLLPVEPVWGNKYPLHGMIRLSVGIEDISFLESTMIKTLNDLS
ncbi:MAG: aminotransferase class V-fold PLP-dependent enzyme [Bacteroidota bacterium]|nr:aminotransferase class V-fold PLP-dependent enzyme [Bacteroidota bacterium]